MDGGRGFEGGAGSVLDDDAAILAILDRPRAGRDCAGRSPAHASVGALGAEPDHPAARRPEDNRCRSRKRRAMSTALETKGLGKQFGGLNVPRDLSLRIDQGTRQALIGQTGAGTPTVSILSPS